MPVNALDQPIGEPVVNFTPGERPHITHLEGNRVIVEPLSVEKHLHDTYEFFGPTSPERQWTYLPLDSFSDFESFTAYFTQMAASHDPYHLAIINKSTGTMVGIFSLMRIDTANRVVEMGWVLYSDKLKRTALATEAQFLVMQYVFETLKYRRYEWKCDSLNAPSANAAQRLGFTYEGTFRSVQVYKGRNRDTKWFSMLPHEYQAMKPKFEKWLSPDNFDKNGQQLHSLNEL